MTKSTIAVLSFLAATVTATPAFAAQCAAHDDLTKVLDSRFSESRSALGLSGQSHVIELFVSTGGSWTLLATDTAGQTCVVGSGEAWQDAPAMVVGAKS